MQDNKFSSNREHDQFDKLVSGMLENHAIPVGADCWEEIEKEIRPRHKEIKWWYIGSAAIVIGILMLFIDPLNDDPNTTTAEAPIATSIIEESNIYQKNRGSNDKIILGAAEEKDNSQAQLNNKKHRSVIKKQTSPKLLYPADSLHVDNKETQQVLLVEQEKKEIPTNKKDSTGARNIAAYESGKSNLSNNIFLSEEPLLLAKAESRNNWTFGLGIGTGGGISLLDQQSHDQLNSDFESSNPGGIITDPNFENTLKDEAWDFNYSLPISFGFMVKKDFNNIVGIESGLVYTYLSTDMKRQTKPPASSRLSQKGTLQVHYIGIPANIVVDMWKNPRWNIYVSAGVMLEKGVRSHQKITSYKNNEEIEVDQRSKNWIRGSQWSLNGTVGVSYKLAHSWGLYAEPRVSYYFDNNQPMSIRTDKSTLFNLNVGVKFNLK